MMRKRYNYNIDFAKENAPASQLQHQPTAQEEFPKKISRKYSNTPTQNNERELPYRNCVDRYRNAYHFMLKEELKVHSRNMIYLKRNQQQYNQFEPSETSPRELREIFAEN